MQNAQLDPLDIAAAMAAPAETPTPHEEPHAGGNYLRDPVTGALSINPAFEIPQE